MFKEHSLYLVTGEETSGGRSTEEVVKSALAGGVDIVQMREKNLSKDKLIVLGNILSDLCRKNNAVFIVNDDPFLAKEVDSGGVHLGQEDIVDFPIEKTRKIIGKEKIIGISTHSLGQFKTANNSDVDYIAFGPLFPTKTKDYFIGIEDVKTVINLALKPVVFIGGINSDNISKVLGAGGRNIAVIRAITQADDIEGKVKFFKQIIDYYKKVCL